MHIFAGMLACFKGMCWCFWSGSIKRFAPCPVFTFGFKRFSSHTHLGGVKHRLLFIELNDSAIYLCTTLPICISQPYSLILEFWIICSCSQSGTTAEEIIGSTMGYFWIPYWALCMDHYPLLSVPCVPLCICTTNEHVPIDNNKKKLQESFSTYCTVASVQRAWNVVPQFSKRGG